MFAQNGKSLSGKKRDKKAYEKNVENSKVKEICKFFRSGSCQKGDDCPFSHNLNSHPCKFIHATGTCRNGDECQFSHRRLEIHEIPIFIQENEEFLEQMYKVQGFTNLGEYYERYRMDREQQRQEQQREEMEEKLKNSLLPDDMKREIIAKEVETRFPSKNLNNIQTIDQPHRDRQMFENRGGPGRGPPGGNNMVMRGENMRDQGQIHQQRPSQIQNTVQPQMPNMMPSQMVNQMPGQVSRKMSSQMRENMGNRQMSGGQGIPPQMQRRGMPSNHVQNMVPREQINQEMHPRGGRNFIRDRDNLVPNTMNRQMYNSSPNVPQNRHQSNRMNGRPREFSLNGSPLRNEEMGMQQRMPPSQIRHHPYNVKNGNGMAIHNNPPMNQEIPIQNKNSQISPKREYRDEDFDKIDFFPKDTKPSMANSGDEDEYKELVRLGILPEDYENISISDDSDE